MFKFVLPKIECEASTKNYGRFSISPLETGYGTTIGNALRRVLLSSLSGAAVTSVRVGGVFHEFSDIPSAKEDMTTLILNVKHLRLRSSAEGAVRLQVSTRGKSEITAADIECPADVEIINPELHLLTLDSSDSELDIEFTVERGRGYSPAEEREKLPIGQIPVDAIFSPITKTSYSVQRTRVGQVTDYDRLVLEIWTDGTLRPAEALSASAQILVRHMTPIVGVSEVPAQEAAAQTEVSQPSVSRQIYDTPIENLELSVRAYNCLKRAGITRVGEILDKLAKGQSELLSIRNFGQKSFDELLTKLHDKGFLTDEGAVPEGQTATEQGEPVQAATAADAAADDASEDTDGNDEDGAGQE